MIRPPLRPLSDSEKDALIAEQAELLRQQGAMIEELVRRLNVSGASSPPFSGGRLV